MQITIQQFDDSGNVIASETTRAVVVDSPAHLEAIFRQAARHQAGHGSDIAEYGYCTTCGEESIAK